MKIEDGIIGFAIGDAMGVPVEFISRKELLLNPVTEMLEYGTYNMSKGCWSDDTSMTLATMDSIIHEKCINTDDMAVKFLKWYRNAEYTATGKVFDIGTTTQQSLIKFERKYDVASNCGGEREFDNGNGSLMRMLPLAYYCFSKNLKDKKIIDITNRVSSITHKHQTSILGCYIYIRFAMELLNKKDIFQAYQEIKELDYSYFESNIISKYERILNNDIVFYNIEKIKSSGYVVDTLESVFWSLLNTNSFDKAIIKAVNLGGDTDTIGACVGGLAGVYYGVESINKEWKNNLIKYDYIMRICKEFEEALQI